MFFFLRRTKSGRKNTDPNRQRPRATRKLSFEELETRCLLSNTLVVVSSSVYGSGSQNLQGSSIALAGGNIYVAGTESANTTQSQALLLQYGIPPGSSPTNVATLSSITNFSGVAATTTEVVAVGSAVPPSYGTVDNVGAVESKTLLTQWNPASLTLSAHESGPVQSSGSTAFFPYSGVEQYIAVTTTVESGTPYTYATGYAQTNGDNNTAILTKSDATGNLQWWQAIGNTGAGDTSVGEALTVLNGHIYVAGYTRSNPTQYYAALWGYDSSGNQIFADQDTTDPSEGFSGITSFGGDLFAVGSTTQASNTPGFLIEKFDPSGKVLWRDTPAATGTDEELTGVVAVGQELFAVGYTNSGGGGTYQAVILEIDPSTGAILSQTQLANGTLNEKATAVATDGTYLYVVGQQSTSQGGQDIVLYTVEPPQQQPANVTSVSVDWGTQSIAVQTAADGLRLLPAGRNTDMPWTNISAISITLSQPETLSPGDVAASGITVANYGPVTISGSGTSYTITLAQPITKADRVTISIGNAGISNFTGRLDVLPGDVSDDGVVTLADGVSIIQNYSPPKVYSAFRDLNGAGLVNVNDFNAYRPYLNTAMPNVPIVLAQLAAGGPGPGGFPQLTNAALEPVLADAIALWTASGIPAQDVALLHRVTAQIAPLPDGYLGGAALGGLTIYLSPDAAGYGWNTTTGNLGGEDLETVVVHELGHSLGLYDLSPAQVGNDLMTETLAPGVSRLPSALDVAAVDAIYAAASNASQSTPTSAALPADPGLLAAAVFSTQPSLGTDWSLPAPFCDAPASGPETPAPGAAVILADQTKTFASVDLPRPGADDEGSTNNDVWPDIFGEGKA